MTEEEKYQKYKEIMLEGNQDIDLKNVDAGDKGLIAFLGKGITADLKIREFDTKCEHKFYIMDISNDNHIIYIPRDVEHIESKFAAVGLYSYPIQALRGTVKVQGGEGLKAIDGLFADCIIDVLDLSKLKITNALSIDSAFKGSQINELRLGNGFKVSNINRAFERGTFGDLNLNSLDMSEVAELNWTFSNTIMKSLHIDKWNTEKVESMSYMFSGVSLNELNLTSWNLENLRYASNMLGGAWISLLDISNINISKLRNKKDIFNRLETFEIKMRKEDYENEEISKEISKINEYTRIAIV